ncbi:MAG: ATP phosphoribosyltransferase regulatory subunit [Ottowia sp.]|nr:ATP phosphoribosyltransferase regulatory subunit [Ottowia sp.]
MSAWLLPDSIADVLPNGAASIEHLRRGLLDTARSYGYELVIPPVVEYLESLLTGTGEALGLQTFKLVDQLSGRMLGVRADSTPQVARMDAHLLSRNGIARLCYCGPVLHTRPERALATREPLQLGAEIYGSSRIEADLEILHLALDCLHVAAVSDLHLDLADVRIVQALLAAAAADAPTQDAVHRALDAKDASALAAASQALPAASQQQLQALVGLYGDTTVLDEAGRLLGGVPGVSAALADLRWLVERLHDMADVTMGLDLSDASGWGYYTGPRFSVYSRDARDAVLRGGRYDGVGAAFDPRQGARPAAGFSLDLKQLAEVAAPAPAATAVRAAWHASPDWARAVAELRARGEIVVCVLPGHESERGQLTCTRELVRDEAGRWQVVAC